MRWTQYLLSKNHAVVRGERAKTFVLEAYSIKLITHCGNSRVWSYDQGHFNRDCMQKENGTRRMYKMSLGSLPVHEV